VADTPLLVRARSDRRDWLVEADEPLAALQLRSGGELPGIIASPSLLELVRKARRCGLKLARAIEAQGEREQVTAWVEVEPERDGDGCTISIREWQTVPLAAEDEAKAAARRDAIDRICAELTARLGSDQEVFTVECDSPELEEIADRLREGIGKRWTELLDVEIPAEHREPLNWRLPSAVQVRVPGSARHWKARLLPLGRPEPEASGFDLLLLADEPAIEQPLGQVERDPRSVFDPAMRREIAPVLRQSIARIIDNAKTIRVQLAGPLAAPYSEYAADINSAGEHLLALVDDLADLEVIESDDFKTAPDRIDLADAARRAAGILGLRAREQHMTVRVPDEVESVPAIGELRRVLQILLNLLENALRYAPAGSEIILRAERQGDRARVIVADFGEGLDSAQQEKVFGQFERLGRSGNGGSGLGLYISRRLARAMKGDLSVESAPGEGARFTLDLPAAPGS
jgi:signal transduction histidine kinase